MILQSLTRLYEVLAEQEKVSRRGWCTAKVSYGINLSKEGEVKGIVWLKEEETRGKKTVWLPSSTCVPEMVTRSSRVSANFLCDNAKYMLGIDKEMDEKSRQRAKDCFSAAKEKHLSLLHEIKGEMSQAICRFFETWNPDQAMEHPEIKENWENITDGGNLVFCMGTRFAQDDPQIKEAWEAEHSISRGEPEEICLVTGEKTEIARIHKTIKGVPGAQSSGAALVSFNAPAFESYGKEQSYNAPVGKYAEFAYTTALNYLLSQKAYSFLIGDTMVVTWAESAQEEYQKGFIWSVEPPKDNQKLIASIFKEIQKNQKITVNDIKLDPEQKFHILGLAPNAARIVVRFYYQNSFGNILKNISKHYERMEMIKPAWEDRDYLGVWQMLGETVNMKSRDKKPVPNMAAMTTLSIIEGSRYPASLYTDVLMRIRSEQGKVTWGRASIIKAYLIQNFKWEEGKDYMGLNEASNETAYLLGRLFSVLELIQMDANPGIKSTIRDRYFNSACTTPSVVFPILLKLKNSHIKKIERDKEGSKIYYEKLLISIMGKLQEYPTRLSLEDQGKFILGYYHQMQKHYEKKGDK